MKTLLVLGGTGTMGSRVVRLARRALAGAEVIAASRGGAAVDGGPARRVDLGDAASLAAGLAGVEMVVNAVGPYRYDPAPLVGACVRARAHYADLAEEPGFVAAVGAAARAAGAREAGLSVVPGCSTVPGFLALLASKWRERDDVAELRAWLALGSRNPIGLGLLRGLVGPLGRSAPDGTRYFRGTRRHTAGDGVARRFGRYPSGFAHDRLPLGARSVPIRFYTGFDRALLTRGLAVAAPLLARLPERALDGFARVALPGARLARFAGTPRGSFRLEAVGADGRELDRIEVVAERDGLDVPAAPPVWLARRLHAGAPTPAGCVSLADAVPIADALAWLRASGVTVRGLGADAQELLRAG